ncbi:MAG: HD domain-containing protein [Muribaculaceae bacterium]|nr:HD domain-containing protein [Muribaculaceae bacterium]
MAGTPSFDYQRIIDKYYPEGTRLRDIYMRHGRSVAALALEISSRKQLPLSPEQIEAAAMVHDIGIFLCDAPGIHCHGSEPYIDHGPLGAALLRHEGAPEWAARVAERHTGVGIGDLVPETMLEKLICYADKFYSKSGSMERKPLERVEASIARFGADNLARFHALHSLFA